MFSARLGFMRPNEIPPVPDGPVVPDADPTVAGNMWPIYSRSGSGKHYGESRVAGHAFLNKVTSNWIVITSVLPPAGSQGFIRFNGLDVSEFTDGDGQVSLPQGQGILDDFVFGCFENAGGTTSTQMGMPMYVRDVYIDNSPTSESDVEKIEGWMCHNAGLQDILQTDHAYRSSAPQGFSPSDLTPRAWWHSQTNFDPTGTATWSTVDGVHTLTKDSIGNNETIQSVTEDGISVINFPNSKTVKNTVFAGSKYRADSVAQGSNIHSQGLTIMVLLKIRDMPGVFDQNTIPAYINTNYFALNGTPNQYITGGFRPERVTNPKIQGQIVDTTDSAPDSGNTDVDVANVTTDGGNVSV